jgi:hypothetical protein
MTLPCLDPLLIAPESHQTSQRERGAGWRARGTGRVMREHAHSFDSPSQIVRNVRCCVTRREVICGLFVNFE